MTKSRGKVAMFMVTGFALFAMYFGAGNLIFPVMIGVDAGTNLTPAILGFLATGVLLPALGMIAASTGTPGERNGIVERLGHYPGLVVLVIIFLSTGMLYAVPRVATVSYEIAIKPLLPGQAEGYDAWALLVYTLIFFVVVVALAVNPSELITRIGGWLTPGLLILLIVLIVSAIVRMPALSTAPVEPYLSSPAPTGLLQGYFTMDALAALVFGVVIITSLRREGYKAGSRLIGATTLVSLIASVCLAAVYLGLSQVGNRVADQGFTQGAEALAHVTIQLFRRGGLAIFGIIVSLACLTTAIGLIGASTQYFRTLLPKVSHRNMILGQVLIAFGLANLGLETILFIVSPINQLIYPITIVLILVSILDIFIPGHLHWGYRLPAWIAGFISIFEALCSTKIPVFDVLRDYLDLLPLGYLQLAWVVPAAVMFVIGCIIDVVQGRLKVDRMDLPENQLGSGQATSAYF